MDTSSCQESSIPWIKVTSKRGCSPPDESTGEAKHSIEDSHWLHPITTNNHFSALSTDESSDVPQSTAPGSNPKPPPIFMSDVTTIPPLLQLLDQITHQQYEIKALAHNQVRIQPKTPDNYNTIIKALTGKNTSHTFKPKEERSYRVVLKHMHFSINPFEIQTEIEKLEHTRHKHL
jgi:hypothetical protein